MDTRVLPIGCTYTGSNRAPATPAARAQMHTPAARAQVAAPAAHTPAPVHGPVSVPTPAPGIGPVTYGNAAPVASYGNAAPVVVYRQVAPTNSSAIVALVLSVISFISSAFFLGFIAIIFGHIARRQIKRRGERGNGMAVAGLWVGYLSVIFWIVFWLVYLGIIALVMGFAIAAETGTIS